MTIAPMFMWGLFAGLVLFRSLFLRRAVLDERENNARLADQYRIAYLDDPDPSMRQTQCAVNSAATDLGERIRRGERAPLPVRTEDRR